MVEVLWKGISGLHSQLLALSYVQPTAYKEENIAEHRQTFLVTGPLKQF